MTTNLSKFVFYSGDMVTVVTPSATPTGCRFCGVSTTNDSLGFGGDSGFLRGQTQPTHQH